MHVCTDEVNNLVTLVVLQANTRVVKFLMGYSAGLLEAAIKDGKS